MSEQQIIAVVGATGAQGGGLVRAILDGRGGRFAARALTRNPGSARARELAALGVEVVRAELDDEGSLREAFDGARPFPARGRLRVNVAGGSFVRQVRAGKVPIFSGGTAVFSFTHADDTATAVAAALDKDANGVLNIVGHEPGRMTSCPRPSCSNACTRWA